MNSRTKGKRGELEVAHLLKKYGYDARRGQQFAGINGDADVVGLPGIHLEVKRVEKLNIENAVDQSIRDAREDEKPAVLHRKNRRKWLVTMPFDEWIDLYQAWEKANERIHKDSQVAP
jgi:Holliday junction resolvase